MTWSVAQLYMTLCSPMDCSSPGSVHRTLWARIQEDPPPGDLPWFPSLEPKSPASPALQVDSLLLSHWGSQLCVYIFRKCLKEYMCLVTRSCLTLCNRLDCGLPGSSVHELLQARILECVAFCFSRGSSQARDWPCASCIAGGFFTVWSTRWLDGNTDSMDLNFSKLWEVVKDREAWRAAIHGVAKNQTWLWDWTTTAKP